MKSDFTVYIGTYTRRDSEGIYVYKMDLNSGKLSYSSKVTGIENPSFLVTDSKFKNLYAISEIDQFEGEATGIVVSYSISSDTGNLTYLNKRLSQGTIPCHLQVNETDEYLLLANYGSGSVASFPIMKDGSLDNVSSFIQHQGSSINPERQLGPHAHSINLDSKNQFAFSPDLGTDKIMSYKFDSENGTLTANDISPYVKTQPGAGPRHFDFHPTKNFAYAINELDSTITAFIYNPDKGKLKPIQTITTLPDDCTTNTSCADIHVSPDGKFVYGSNRGHDSIARFAVDEKTGYLTPLGHTPTQGAIPRNFAIDPTGQFMLVANQDSDTVITFKIDPKAGDLIDINQIASVPMPVCIKFAQI